MPDAQQPQPPKHRSPSYPAIDLEKALLRVQRLHTEAGRHPAPVSSALQAWGYSPKSSGGRLALAALKKFGLIEDEGSRESRTVRVSDLGRALLYYDQERENPEWTTRAQQAALTPSIHKELWDKYAGALPSDGVIRPYLVFERDFSESAADELLKEFRATVAFSGLATAGATLPETDEDSDEDGDHDDDPDGADSLTTPALDIQGPKGDQSLPGTKERRTVQVTYSTKSWALLQAEFPMSPRDWDRMMAVLEGMKLGLVEDETD